MDDVTIGGRSRAISDLDPAKLRTLRRQVMMLTQGELATAAGISRGEVSHLETGKRKPLATTLRRLCIALECEPTDLLINGSGAHKESHAEREAEPAGADQARETAR